MKQIALAALPLLALAACAEDPMEATEVRDELGCASFTKVAEEPPLFVLEEYTCRYGDIVDRSGGIRPNRYEFRETTVQLFANEDDKDNYLEAAEFLGGVDILNEGPNWLELS